MRRHASRRSLAILKYFFLILALWTALAWAVHPAQAQDVTPPPADCGDAGRVTEQTQDQEEEGTLVVARYYAKRFKGRKTSSGERYDPAKLTAAHPTLPLGTEVQVINPANNKSVIVTINDRCRQRKELYIDLSRQAARELGILRHGKAMVRIISLENDEGDPDQSSADEQDE